MSFEASGFLHGEGTGGQEGGQRPRSISKGEAREGLRRLQRLIGLAFLLSTVTSVYLLVTDGSLWLLAVSHALGLVVIALIGAVLGVMNLGLRKNVYLPSLAAAFLGILLQLGDILTAPQYNMTVQYFAGYLFTLWAFDLLLLLQGLIISLGVFGRGYATYLARRRTRRGRELSYSKRGFVKAVAGFAGLVGLAVAAGSIKLPSPATGSQSGQRQQTTQSGGAIANANDLKVGSPVYFEYPSGYPNVLFKNADGSLTALSMLCTHVCCQCSYDGSSNEIYCPCHGSIFSQSGKVLRGPAYLPLPSIELRVDGQGNIFPVGTSGSSPCLQA